MPNGASNCSHTHLNPHRLKLSYFISNYTLNQSKRAASNGTIPPISMMFTMDFPRCSMFSYGFADFQPNNLDQGQHCQHGKAGCQGEPRRHLPNGSSFIFLVGGVNPSEKY